MEQTKRLVFFDEPAAATLAQTLRTERGWDVPVPDYLISTRRRYSPNQRMRLGSRTRRSRNFCTACCSMWARASSTESV